MTNQQKRIFIYGDSNVWGDNFSGSRIRYSDRWVNRLARSLRGKAQVVANGVCGRVAGDFRKDKPSKNGLSPFASAIKQISKPDIVIIALGTNDLQQRYRQMADDILKSMTAYKQIAGDAKIVFILPPAFDAGDASGPEFTEESERVRQQLIQNRDQLGDCLELPNISLSDGIHFSPKGHYQVFKSVKYVLKSYL